MVDTDCVEETADPPELTVYHAYVSPVCAPLAERVTDWVPYTAEGVDVGLVALPGTVLIVAVTAVRGLSHPVEVMYVQA